MIDDPQPVDKDGWEQWCTLTRQAYGRYHDQLLAVRGAHPGLVDYNASSRVRATAGTMAWRWSAESEVRETINSINDWGDRLHSWHAWNKVLASFEDEIERWEVLHSFVGPIAFFCMLQPTSTADRIALTAENLLHQAKLLMIPGYADSLEQDKAPDRPLRRSDRRKQLNRLGSCWARYGAFRDALNAMDGVGYQTLTGNFRDLTSHAFAPRFMIGNISRAWRRKVDHEEIVLNGDGTVSIVTDPARKMTQYAMGSLTPLPLDAVYAANLAEYGRARCTMNAFAKLVYELCDRIDAEL